MADNSNDGCGQVIGGLCLLLIVGIFFFWEYFLAILLVALVLSIVWVSFFGRGAKERKLKKLEKEYADMQRLHICTQKVANGMATNWFCSASVDEAHAYADRVLKMTELDFADVDAVDAFRKEWGLDALSQANPNS